MKTIKIRAVLALLIHLIDFVQSPFLLVELPNEAVAKRIASRSVTLKYDRKRPLPFSLSLSLCLSLSLFAHFPSFSLIYIISLSRFREVVELWGRGKTYEDAVKASQQYPEQLRVRKTFL
jgi:hypothetical protein